MAKDAKQYKVTTGYGCQSGYPLNPCGAGKGFHKGEDRAMPIGTPVVVNGVQIGLSGDTGYTTGPHLHVGKWTSAVQPPNGGGFSFKSAKVITVDPIDDDANGKFVRIQADGANWVYLHLSKITCKVGQQLKVPAPAPIPFVRKFHVVRSGDTVHAISRRYGLSIKNNYAAFRKLNPNVKNVNWIYVGQKLRVK